MGQAQDEGGEFLGDRWGSGSGGSLVPLPAQQAAVPRQKGARGDEAVAAQPVGEVLGEGCEHGAVRPRQARPDAELPTQHEDLDVLGVHRPRQQQEQSEQG